jgi:hypothetical protein
MIFIGSSSTGPTAITPFFPDYFETSIGGLVLFSFLANPKSPSLICILSFKNKLPSFKSL